MAFSSFMEAVFCDSFVTLMSLAVNRENGVYLEQWVASGLASSQYHIYGLFRGSVHILRAVSLNNYFSSFSF